ncbi:MAG: alanine racemase, partial [Actinomycetota bacterium]
GYGFGRKTLAEHARKFADLVAVGTVFETSDVPEKCRAIVLTPAGKVLPKNFSSSKQIVLTVGSMHDVKNLADANWTGDVVLKLRSSMNRYGADIEDLPELLDRLKKSHLTQFGWSIHPPLEGSAQENADEITEIITSTDSAISTATDLPWLVSHVDAPQLIALRKKFAKHTIRVRSGTNLWLGDKSNSTRCRCARDPRSLRVFSGGLSQHEDRARRNARHGRRGHGPRRAQSRRRVEPFPLSTTTTRPARAVAHAHLDAFREARSAIAEGR